MKKEELIKELEKLPAGIDVCVFDHRKNMHDCDGTGSSAGVHPEFEVEVIDLDEHDLKFLKEEHGEDFKHWAALSFVNNDYEE